MALGLGVFPSYQLLRMAMVTAVDELNSGSCTDPRLIRRGVTTSQGLARHLLDRYCMGVLPASIFGEDATALRMRVATGLLYGDTDAERECAIACPGPVCLPWIADVLDRIEEILAALTR